MTLSSIVDPKRKRCSIELCEGYCDDTTISVICGSCCMENRSLRFCAMHVPHISHSGQLGFLEQPLAVVADHPDSQAHVNFVPADNNKSSGAVSTCEVATDVNSVKERVAVASETSAQSLAETSMSLTEEEASSSAPPAVPHLQLQLTAADVTGSSLSTTDLSNVEKKIVRLFEDGFQQSSKTNITPQLKVLGALNHACYKKHLGIIVTHFNLSSVDIPTITALGSNAVREKYLTAVVNAYDETRKGKIGV
jgi:hypothetical protein